MIDTAFQYDCMKKDWVRCGKDEYVHKDIEKLPCVLVSETIPPLGDAERFVFCPKHRRMESVKAWGIDFVESADGCIARGLIALDACYIKDARADYVKLNSPNVRRMRGVFLPYRWRVFQRSPEESVHIACDVAEVNYEAFKQIGKFRRWHCYSVSADMIKRKYQFSRLEEERLDVESGFWAEVLDADIPDAVMDVALEALRENTRLAIGIKPTVLSTTKNAHKLLAYIERPLDVNIVFLKTFLKEFIGQRFDIVFPYEQTDNYKTICQLLEIRPPKSVRKAYAYNPYAIVWYMLFQEWGYTDINLIQRFLYLTERVSSDKLSDMFYDRKQSCVMAGIWISPEVGHYAGFMREHGRGKHFLNWLYRFSTTETLTDWQKDLLRMHRNAGRYLSENTKAHLLRDGLTHAVHDMAVEDLNTRRWERTHLSELPNVHMNYPALVLDYECEITCGNNRYEFHVIQDTKKLLEVGRTLHNCVAGYYREVIDKYSIIVAVRHDNIWVVCIEIREQRTIAQALGLHNRLLEGELLAVCQYWMKVKNLVLNTNHLNFRAPEDKERAETFWEYMDLHELPTA